MSSECLEPAVQSLSSDTEMSYGSLILGHCQQMPFLRLLESAMQAEEETEEEEEQQLRLQVVQQQQQQVLFTSVLPESNFQLLLRLQSHNDNKWTTEIDSSRPAEQLESCITRASKSRSDARGFDGREPHHPRQLPCGTTRSTAAAAGPMERRKRKRSRAALLASTKSAEEAESQRMTHIAVERNRRRLMNDHLAALRALMPPSFVQRGDQASIIGGAIDFVKELEQLLLLLLAEKRQRKSAIDGTSFAASTCATLSRSSIEEDVCPTAAPATAASLEGFFVSPQYTSYLQSQQHRRRVKEGEKDGAESPEAEVEVDVEATVVQGHVNLKVAGRRRAGQLVRAIAALEELRLSVLHLNVTSLHSSILYSLNVKMEEGCKLGTADEIATAVHQIFSYSNACR